ncbi:hypothetical protein [Mesobacillus selenatarsenatis]|uniref:Uncharacterized protein n=1 Tax=Mesobacillus selenatarsenatis (strain DSM 18680 / JCM 14380 / FERM P-15431 / SF-1) TaxID=1321606 RepID=A0A0A8XCT1_MESS1|nr:hypothetical protein [Mesobacillus selenatarsenatis]GAM15936.1 hypothetical protein SAMD00020551_4107 [Mesobacillus selenatarsenatis SF-1]
MKSKLILVEGLPGSGKSTTARMIHDILIEKGLNAGLYMEGNLDHPADYEGVAYFTEEDFENLLIESGSLSKTFQDWVTVKGGRRMLPYMKIKSELGSGFPDELFAAISKKDVYELPLKENIAVIVESWAEFARKAESENKVYVFECCFIQNPVTVGMVKYGAPDEVSIEYVQKIGGAVKLLDPLLVYVKQEDIEISFRKAVAERPEDWFKGFIQYYTSQGYGAKKELSGLEGTIEVLKARQQLEYKILEQLTMPVSILDNTQFNLECHRNSLRKVIMGENTIEGNMR